MANRKARRIKLSADERAVLDRRVRRRKIARADAQRAEIILRAADGLNNWEIAGVVGVTRQTVRTWRDRFAKHRLMASTTSRDAVRRARLAMTGSRILSQRRSKQSPQAPRTGARAAWRRWRAYRRRRSIGSGRPSACSRIARRRSSCRPIRSSSRRCATLSDSISIRSRRRWSSASMKKPNTSP